MSINSIRNYNTLNEYIKSFEQNKNLTPYTVIHFLAEKHWDRFVKSAMQSMSQINFTDRLKKVRTTSCVNTFCSLSSLFCGRAFTEGMIYHLFQHTSSDLDIILPSGQAVIIKISNLFDGAAISRHKSDQPFSYQSQRQIRVYKNEAQCRFLEYLHPLLEQKKTGSDEKYLHHISSVFSNILYNFNSEAFNQLKEDINFNTVDEEQSEIYFVGISQPKKDQLDQFEFEHVFIIEQFWHDSSRKEAFRIYQSWISKVTLNEDLHRDQRPDPILDKKQITHFIENLESLFSHSPKTTYKECFGYDPMPNPLLSFDGVTLTGKSLRYCSRTIHPNQCLENLLFLIDQQPKLKAAIYPEG